MQVTETLNEGLKRAFEITVPKADIDAKVSERLKDISKTATLPGFRAGKVPAALLKKRYGDSLRGEVLQQTITESSQAAIEERDLKPAMNPDFDLDGFKPEGDLTYKMSFEVLPEISAMDFKKLKIERPVVDVDDKAVDEALTNLASRAMTSEPISGKRKSKDGDIVVIDFDGEVDGERKPALKADGFNLELGSGMFIPGFEEQVTGAKAGEEVKVTVTFPADYGAADVAGKEAIFDVKVHEIREKKLPEINDEFAASMGQENLDGLKDIIRRDIGNEYGQAARSVLKRRILDKLDEGHSFDLPEGMVDQEFNAIWQQVEQDKEAGRLEEADKEKSEDDLKAEYRKIAERRVKLGLLLSDVGTSNEIQITEDDLNKAVMTEARKYPGQEADVVEFFRKNQQAQMNLRAPILEDKVIDFIAALADVKDETVSPEGLIEMVQKMDADAA